MAKRSHYLKRLQRRLSRQVKGSNRHKKTRLRIARQHQKIADIRNDFCHKTSRELVDSKAWVIIQSHTELWNGVGWQGNPRADYKTWSQS